MFFFNRKRKKRILPENLVKLQNTEDPSWVWDPDYAIIVWANEAGLRFWGVENGAELRELFFSDTHPLTLAGMNASEELTENDACYEYLFLNPAGDSIGYKFFIGRQSLPDGRGGLLMIGDLGDYRHAAETADEESAENAPLPEALLSGGKQPFDEDKIDRDLQKLSAMSSERDFLGGRFSESHPDTAASALKSAPEEDRVDLTETADPTEENTDHIIVNAPARETVNETAPLPIIDIDRNGVTLRANDAARNAFMLKEGNSFIGLFEDAAQGRLVLAALFADERPKGKFNLIAFGSPASYLLHAAKTPDDRIRLALTPADGVRSETDDEEMRETPSSLLNLMSAAGVAVFLLGRNGTVKTACSVARELTGLYSEDLIGRPFSVLFAEADKIRAEYMFENEAGLQEALEEGAHMRYIGAAGEERVGRIILRRNVTDKEAGYWALLYDETPLDEMRREIDLLKEKVNLPTPYHQADAPAEVTSHTEIPPIVAAVSHEVRAPLNAVSGYAEMLEQEIFGPLGDGRYKEYARQIGAASKYMSEIINDLLDLSKVNSGEFSAETAPTDLNKVIDESIAALYPVALKKDIEISGTVLSGTPLIQADPRLLKQAVINLLSNAVNYSPEGEQVYIAAGPTKSGRVMIEVTDFGGGMTAEELEKAAKPFARLKEANGINGTGLGLPLAKRLTEVQGARFSIDSVPNEKTRARIVFPETALLDAVSHDFSERV